MAKVALRDDLRGPCCSPPVIAGGTAGLEDDCGDPEDVEWELPTVTVRHRVFVEYDEDGDPVWVWEPLFTAVAIAGEQRTEIDDVAGLTLHVVDLTMPYSGGTNVPETITIVTSDGYIFTVSKVVQTVSTVRVVASRIEDDEAVGSTFDGGDPGSSGDGVLDGGGP